MDRIEYLLEELVKYENELKKIRHSDKFSIMTYLWLLKIENYLNVLQTENLVTNNKTQEINQIINLLESYLPLSQISITNCYLLCEIYCKVLECKNDKSVITKLVEYHMNLIKKRAEVKPINFIILVKAMFQFNESAFTDLSLLYSACIANFKTYDVTVKYECTFLLASIVNICMLSVSLIKDTFKLISQEPEIPVCVFLIKAISKSISRYDQSFLNNYEFYINICLKLFENNSNILRKKTAKLIAVILNKLLIKNQSTKSSNFTIISILELISPLLYGAKINEIRVGLSYTLVELIKRIDSSHIICNINSIVKHFYACQLHLGKSNLDSYENHIYIEIYTFILESLAFNLHEEKDKLMLTRRILSCISHEITKKNPCDIVIVISLKLISKLIPTLGMKITNFMNCNRKKNGKYVDSPLDVFLSLLYFNKHEILLHASYCINTCCKYYPETAINTLSQLVVSKQCDDKINQSGVSHSIFMALLGSLYNGFSIPSFKINKIVNDTINEMKDINIDNTPSYSYLSSILFPVCLKDQYLCHFIDDLIDLWYGILINNKDPIYEGVSNLEEFKNTVIKCNTCLSPLLLIMIESKLLNNERWEKIKKMINECLKILILMKPTILSTPHIDFNNHINIIEFLVTIFAIAENIPFNDLKEHSSHLNSIAEYFILCPFTNSVVSNISEPYSELIDHKNFINNNYQRIESIFQFPLYTHTIQMDAYTLYTHKCRQETGVLNYPRLIQLIDSALIYLSNSLINSSSEDMNEILSKMHDSFISITNTCDSEVAFINILCFFIYHLKKLSKNNKYIEILPIFYNFFSFSKIYKKYHIWVLTAESIGLLFKLLPCENFKLIFDEIFSNSLKESDEDSRVGSLLILGFILNSTCLESEYLNRNQSILSLIISFTKSFNSEKIKLISVYITSKLLRIFCTFVHDSIECILRLIIDISMKTTLFHYEILYYLTQCYLHIFTLYNINDFGNSNDIQMSLKCLIDCSLKSKKPMLESMTIKCLFKIPFLKDSSCFFFERINDLLPLVINKLEITKNIPLITSYVSFIDFITESQDISTLDSMFNKSISSEYRKKHNHVTNMFDYIFQIYLSLSHINEDLALIQSSILKLFVKTINRINLKDWLNKCYYIIVGTDLSLSDTISATQTVEENKATENGTTSRKTKSLVANTAIIKKKDFSIKAKLFVLEILDELISRFTSCEHRLSDISNFIEDTLKLTYFCVSSNHDLLKRKAIKIVLSIVKTFTSTCDSVEINHSILEQYQAILISILQTTLSDTNDYKMQYYACEIITEWINNNPLGTDIDHKRVLQLLSSSLELLKYDLNDSSVIFNESCYAKTYLSLLKVISKIGSRDAFIINSLDIHHLAYIYSMCLNCCDDFCYLLSSPCILCHTYLQNSLLSNDIVISSELGDSQDSQGSLDSPDSPDSLDSEISIKNIISYVLLLLTSCLFKNGIPITVEGKKIKLHSLEISISCKEYICYNTFRKYAQSKDDLYLTHYYIVFFNISIQQIYLNDSAQNEILLAINLTTILTLFKNTKFNYLLLNINNLVKETTFLLISLQFKEYSSKIHDLILNIYLSMIDLSEAQNRDESECEFDFIKLVQTAVLYENEMLIPKMFSINLPAMYSDYKQHEFDSYEISKLIWLLLKLYVSLLKTYVKGFSFDKVSFIFHTFLLCLQTDMKLGFNSHLIYLHESIKIVITIIHDANWAKDANDANDVNEAKECQSQLSSFIYHFINEITDKSIQNETDPCIPIKIIALVIELCSNEQVLSSQCFNIIFLCEKCWSKLFSINESSKICSCEEIIYLLKLPNILKSVVNASIKVIIKLILDCFVQFTYEKITTTTSKTSTTNTHFNHRDKVLFEKFWHVVLEVFQISSNKVTFKLLTLLFPNMLALISSQTCYYYKPTYRSISFSYINKIGHQNKPVFRKFMAFNPYYKKCLEHQCSIKNESTEDKASSQPDIPSLTKAKIALKLDFSNFK